MRPEQARKFYDRFGAKQDKQGFYEDPALDALVRHGEFARAERVVEFGCGTGRLAARLLFESLPGSTTYLGLDLSATMTKLAAERLAPWGPRAEVRRTEGGMALDLPADSCDRFVSTYVLDLLGEADIAVLLDEAYRVLRPGGLLCLAGLTEGTGPLSRVTMSLWRLVHGIRPSLVGGCRPLRMAPRLPPHRWRVRFHAVRVAWCIPSEVLVAEKAGE